MSKSRLELKVGLFVFLGLALLAFLLILFSKGITFLQPTYQISLQAPNVGGLKSGAVVLMSGVQVGTVSDIQLAPDGKSVAIALRIRSQYQQAIHHDALFVLEQSGFLGDQYVAILPTRNEAPIFQNGEIAHAEAPFNLQEFTRTATGFISRIDDTVKKLNEALMHVTDVVLTPRNLTNLSVLVANLRTVSDKAVSTIDDIKAVVTTNGPGLALTVTNLALFSQQLNQFAADLNQLVAANSNAVARTVQNIEASSEGLNATVKDLNEGRGLAGTLLKDQGLANSVSAIASNLSITSSNLNRLGLWGILWQHKPPKTNEPLARPLTAPKNPYAP